MPFVFDAVGSSFDSGVHVHVVDKFDFCTCLEARSRLKTGRATGSDGLNAETILSLDLKLCH
eukprot:7025731-Karenia_brevis.AAC.1